MEEKHCKKEKNMIKYMHIIRIDCQVKCNTIREKIFEAPRRESGN